MNRQPRPLLTMTLGALGVVFGDIGTSPLYAVKECFSPDHGIMLSPDNVFGILSLIFWSLTLVVSVKYLGLILRADNKGEGGILALVALLLPRVREKRGVGAAYFTILLGIFGAALLYGDGVITPAISVLSAIEGLQVAAPALKPFVVPLTVVILVALFLFQSKGTEKIGSVFGPTTLVWFATIGAIGVPWIVHRPEILLSVNPLYALRFFITNRTAGFFVLSAVVLCITGAEALYADMGHFGKRPIRFGWFAIVFPALLLNYFGQGALILDRGEAVLHNPFFEMVSGFWVYPLIAIATAATVIASQALISGAYSLTQQAVQLGYLPRLLILHTSAVTEGQIYIPRTNEFLMIGCVALVLAFTESTNLAAAYGIAVTGTMVITSLLFYAVARTVWNWSAALAGSFLVFFLAIDLSFFLANSIKLVEGGWVPVMIAVGVFVIMTTWKRGRLTLAEENRTLAMPLNQFFESIAHHKMPTRVKGTAIFLTLGQDLAPPILLHHLKHNHVLHDRVVLLTIVTVNEPEVEIFERVRITDLEHGFVKVVARHGFMQTPDISEVLIHCLNSGLTIDPNTISFFLGRETLLTTGRSGMALWRKKLFIFLSRNARPATDYFRLPPDQVIEIGSQVQI